MATTSALKMSFILRMIRFPQRQQLIFHSDFAKIASLKVSCSKLGTRLPEKDEIIVRQYIAILYSGPH